MNNFKIATLNCHGLGDSNKRAHIFDNFKLKHFDCVLLQETHVYNLAQAKRFEAEWGGKCFWSFGNNFSKGVGILFNPKLKFTHHYFHFDTDGRLLVVDLCVFGINLRIINAYCPNRPAPRREFLKSLHIFFCVNRSFIFGGDFNCIDNLSLDKVGGNSAVGNLSSEVIADLCQSHNLIDPFRCLYPNKPATTWTNSDGSIACRLDRFYTSCNLSNSLIDCVITPSANSDHSVVDVNLEFSKAEPDHGKGYWKCNVAVLTDPDFNDDFVRLWSDCAKTENKDLVWWESCKFKFKNCIFNHSCRLANNHRANLSVLETRLAVLMQNELSQPGKFKDDIAEVKLQMQLLTNKKLEGARVRSKAVFLDNEEKPTSFFLKKEKSRAAKSRITKLVVDGVTISDNVEIINNCRDFYQRLYDCEPIDSSLVDFFLDGLPRLSDESSSTCDGPLSFSECWTAIRAMQNGKTPGSDGLPKEFYERFFHLFGADFINVVNQAYDKGSLSESQRTGLITLICKDPDHPELLENWRPISLLNIDYKIVSKTLASRLGKVLPDIVHKDQTCAVPGRSIVDNLHLLRNVIDYCHQKHTRCAIVSYDQTKAFDRVSHEFLLRVLRAFGFGESFIKWFTVLYTDVRSRVIVNGFLSDFIFIRRSVRQGCALSALLYALQIEPFAHRVRLDPDIRGLRLPGSREEVRISLYADDTTTITMDEPSVLKIIYLFKLFSEASGTLLNLLKCNGMWVGPEGAAPMSVVTWSDVIKVCGVFFGRNSRAQNEKYIIDKLTKVIAVHKSRDLTLRGKVLFINVVFFARLWYSGACVVFSQPFIDAVTRLIHQFIWKTTEYIARHTLICPLADGGLNLLHVPSRLAALRVIHLVHFLRDKPVTWHVFVRYWAGLSLRHFRADLASNLLPHSDWQPDFYRRALADLRVYNSFVPLLNFTDLSLKKVYRCLVAPHCVRPRVENIVHNIDFNVTWKALNNPLLGPKPRDVAFRVAHDVLPVRVFLSRIHVPVQTVLCPFCKIAEECIEHLLFNCIKVKPIWRIVESWACQLTFSSFVLNSDMISFFIFPPCPDTVKSVLSIVFTELTFCVWTRRNEIVFDRQQRSTRDVQNLFLHRLHTRIKADFFRLPRTIFTDLWTQNAVFASVDTDTLQINI
jgi:hypothetical protein